MSGPALGNEYAAQLGALFDEMPKAALAAVAVSALTSGGDRLELAALLVAVEWRCLNANGIVPQRPGPEARRLMALGEDAILAAAGGGA